MIDTYIDEERGRGRYDDYIEKVKTIVESFGEEYLLRTENVTVLSNLRNLRRVIIIRFRDRESLNACFSSEAYKAREHERAESVDVRVVIAED